MTSRIYRLPQMNVQRCLRCGSPMTPVRSPAFHPIDRTYQCPSCGAVHYLLSDKVLCTREDYDRRICRSYMVS